MRPTARKLHDHVYAAGGPAIRAIFTSHFAAGMPSPRGLLKQPRAAGCRRPVRRSGALRSGATGNHNHRRWMNLLSVGAISREP